MKLSSDSKHIYNFIIIVLNFIWTICLVESSIFTFKWSFVFVKTNLIVNFTIIIAELSELIVIESILIKLEKLISIKLFSELKNQIKNAVLTICICDRRKYRPQENNWCPPSCFSSYFNTIVWYIVGS